MKRGMLLLITWLSVVGASLLHAQEPATASGTQYLFKRHAYIHLQGGASYTLGEASFADLLSPQAQLDFGYQFNPVLGLRLGANGWEGKGAWVAPKQLYKWNYVQANLDLTVDLAALFSGFKHDRAVTPYMFIGAGGAYAFNNDEANEVKTGGYNLDYLWKDSKIFPFGRAGIGFDIRLSDQVSFTIEGNANITNDHWNSKQANQPDWHFNALAGIKINFGKKYEVVEPVLAPAPAPAPKPEPKPEPKPVVKPEPKPEPAPAVKEFPTLPTIHFAFDSDVVDTNTYATELAAIVATLKEFADVQVEIIGYTDHAGDSNYNVGLSQRRADAVKRYLVSQGIDGNRLTTVAKGEDPKTSGQEALTIKARRVEVAK